MALPLKTTMILQRRAFLLGAPGALMLLAAGMTDSASLHGAAPAREQLPRDCGFIVDLADARIDLGALPPA